MLISKQQYRLAVCLILPILTINATAASDLTGIDKQINSAYDLLEFQESMGANESFNREESIKRALKLKAMTNYAKSVAIRSGIQSRIEEIHRLVTEHERELDAIYDFNSLMIDGRVSPPVISTASNLYNQTNANQINIAKKLYKIEKQAEFTSVPNNWRQYLRFPVETNAYSKYAYIAGEMKPSNEIELKAWQDATIDGWESGVNQADNLLINSLERLNRDFIGQIRFHELVMEGKLTLPIISQYKLHNTNTGDSLIIDEDMLRLTVLPSFASDLGTPHLPEHSLSPNELLKIDKESFITPPKIISNLSTNRKPIEGKSLLDIQLGKDTQSNKDFSPPIGSVRENTNVFTVDTSSIDKSDSNSYQDLFGYGNPDSSIDTTSYDVNTETLSNDDYIFTTKDLDMADISPVLSDYLSDSSSVNLPEFTQDILNDSNVNGNDKPTVLTGLIADGSSTVELPSNFYGSLNLNDTLLISEN